MGLSNFPEDRLQKIIDGCEVVPQLVQVEAHPYFPQTELKKMLAKYDMTLMAWYPLGHGDKSLLNEAAFTRLAQKYKMPRSSCAGTSSRATSSSPAPKIPRTSPPTSISSTSRSPMRR